MRLPHLIIGLCAVLTACAQVPQLDGTIDAAARDAPFPTLTPIGPILAQAQATSQVSAADVGDISARIAALQSRAAILRRPVIDNATRAAMARGVSNAALR